MVDPTNNIMSTMITADRIGLYEHVMTNYNSYLARVNQRLARMLDLLERLIPWAGICGIDHD